MRNLLIATAILILAGCSGKSSGDNLNEVKVKEVLQVDNYTYLYVKGRGPALWVAVPTMEAHPGETYYYKDGLLMEDFHSEELNRTFDQVLFISELKREGMTSSQRAEDFSMDHMVTIEKSDVDISSGGGIVEGTITISDLYSDPGSYEGKTVRVKGEVTKFNVQIMDRNWIHIQDGTEFEGKYDLMATSTENFAPGTIVTIEGTLALNKDFGYGYTYELLLENAVTIHAGTNTQ